MKTKSLFAQSLVMCSVALASSLAADGVRAQGTPLPVELLPLGKDLGLRSGQTVTPAYEGWYENEDGSLALSFGYYNRNTEEVVNIPIGQFNRIVGAPNSLPNQGQPTRFEVERHWGVFTIDVPADFKSEIAWHLENQGNVFHVPANLGADYIIDAIVGDANGNLPPEISFEANGPIGKGPGGITIGPITARVGEPMSMEAWARDDGKVSGIAAMFVAQSGATPPIDLTWFKHQGPGAVSFSQQTAKIPASGGKVETKFTFSETGDYLLRARLTDLGGPEMAGHSQCCWTNSFVQIKVTE
ncbi:MAG: hypothetical protein CMD92_04390 [Gammaproteobacteria bacterium]|nr:hypothetical protein [Gammaproteobacteria bacterium]HBW83142.1 hypothetical protein [Gammaproteobacteria bacterium]|tara:strand:+ start:22 stop:921 length:900 start_codon:yes stop_codon:yes gene_type:complete